MIGSQRGRSHASESLIGTWSIDEAREAFKGVSQYDDHFERSSQLLSVLLSIGDSRQEQANCPGFSF